MKSYEVLKQVIEAGNIKEISSSLGVSLSTLYKWTQSPEQGSGIPNPLDRVAELHRQTRDMRLIEWLCVRANGFFVTNPTTRKATPEVVNIAANKLVREFAEMISTIATAASDNKINAQESENLRKRWERLKSHSETFVRSCEEGQFDKLHADLKNAIEG